MRTGYRFVLILSILLLALSACGGGGQPANSDQPSANVDTGPTAVISEQVAAILTPAPSVVAQGVPGNEPDELEVPLPGTLVASATEDPEAGLIFSHLRFEMTGGAEGMSLVIELTGDGQLLRDDVVGTVDPSVILRVDDMLDEINFFGLQGTFMGTSPDAEDFTYRLTVTRGGSERMITAQDKYTPIEVKRLFSIISELGLDVPGQ